MSLAQRPSPTASDQSEQPDQTAAVDEARPEELETPVIGAKAWEERQVGGGAAWG
jgi:hypothetical protein